MFDMRKITLARCFGAILHAESHQVFLRDDAGVSVRGVNFFFMLVQCGIGTLYNRNFDRFFAGDSCPNF